MKNEEIISDMTFYPVYYTKPRPVSIKFWDNYGEDESKRKLRETLTLVVENSVCLD
jgi:hypothetical protein